jgi:hypothetical protein
VSILTAGPQDQRLILDYEAGKSVLAAFIGLVDKLKTVLRSDPALDNVMNRSLRVTKALENAMVAQALNSRLFVAGVFAPAESVSLPFPTFETFLKVIKEKFGQCDEAMLRHAYNLLVNKRLSQPTTRANIQVRATISSLSFGS